MVTSSTSADGVQPSGVRPLRADDPCRIGGHRLLGRLGAGGMGVVYLGEDPLGGYVAVKTAHDDVTGDDEPRRRLTAEAACLQRVPQGLTARLLADGTARTPPYIVTEYVEGRSLADVVCKDGPLPPEQLHALAVGLGRALAAIHSAGVVHRDLKPPNVLLTPTGPRLIDFGIAHEVSAVGGPTRPGMVVGSLGWIAPERLDRRPATPAADVFGWGCLVAYAATGRNPFGEGDPDVLARRVMLEPPDLDGLDGRLRSLVGEALAKDPAARPSAADLLGPVGDSDVREPPARRRRWVAGPPAGSRGSGTRGLPLRRRWVVLAATAVALAAVTGAVVVAGGGHDTPSAPPMGVVSPTSPRGNQGATGRVPAPRPRATRSTAVPHPSPSASASASAITTAPAKGKTNKQKGNGKGKGKGKGNVGSGPPRG
jgi:predicted Ser/Thr protein kinase